MKDKKPLNKKIRYGLMLISIYEAVLIKKLRENDFGSWTVTKTEGQPRRIVKGGSEMIDPEEGKGLFEDN